MPVPQPEPKSDRGSQRKPRSGGEGMELVGRAVRKAFDGFGTFAGVVESYDPSAGYFKIHYEDGDSEDLDFEEITSILKEMGEPSPAPQIPMSNRGRSPKKRRRTDRSAADAGAEDDLQRGKMISEGSIAGDPTLGKEGGSLRESHGFSDGIPRETRFLGGSGEIQAGDSCFNGGSAGNSSSWWFEETPQMKGRGFVGHSEENASFGGCRDTPMDDIGYSDNLEGESSSFGSEKDEQGPNKRQKLSGRPKSTREMPLRRSARSRRTTNALSSLDHVLCKDTLASDEAAFEGQQMSDAVPEDPKPALPPSSTDLDIEGLPALDIFSVYACLRSFSRLLFLSPFRLEAFVEALRCRYSNNLIDSIHFCVLQALKPHLKSLSEEGSRSATDCLRNLDWGLLDFVTWPVYLVEYFLTHGPTMRPDFKLTRLKVVNSEYYKQPAAIKLEILRCLCDDVIEVEAIRSELNRRMMGSEVNVDTNCNMNVDKKLKDSTMIDVGSSLLAQEVFEETADVPDGNIDECCLCSMDGNLICCDGCPAAFHSRCVGLAKDLLPEGEWYCPDCLMEKGDGFLKSSKPFRGAEILGIDPHGRLYFGSCGYLLVSDSCDTDASYNYYNKNDLNAVIKVLKSSYPSYSAIINAISIHWEIPIEASCSSVHLGHGIHHVHEDAKVFSKPFSPSEQDVVTDGVIERTEKEICAPEKYGPKSSKVTDLTELNPVTSNQLACMTLPVACSEISDEVTKDVACIHISQQTDTDCSMDSTSLLKKVASLKTTDLVVGQEKCIGFPGWGIISLLTERSKLGASKLNYDPVGYMNYYSFGRIASSIAEELMNAASKNNNMESKKSVDDIKLAQLKAISKKSIKSSWYNYQRLPVDVQKEKCGWCFSCRTSSDNDCLFKVADDKHLEGSKNRMVGLRSEKNKRSHLVSVMHHILSIEDHVRSLLSGPWENPYYFKLWRKAVTKASDVASLKHLLLVLESNLRRVSLSAEWLKPVDSAHSGGSASHMLTSSVHASSNHGGSRRQAKKSISGTEFTPDSRAAAPSGIYWWRGGRLSRQMFHWKMLPRSLAYKGGRQAGCRKIPNILYPDGSELAKRSKFVAWRAAVEMSDSVAQLICQVKDFESNIRLTELSDAQISPQLSKESRKFARLFKKVTIRRKCIEGVDVKYLLDFGRRETVPPVVTRHGVMLEESSNGRKKYWLNEIHVPLNLLKAFEEKKLARMLRRPDLGLLSDKGSKRKSKKPERSKGLSYLLSREPKSQLCGHCNKDVLVREAVNCQFCNGFLHRKHFRVPKGAITTTFTCCRCKDIKSVKENTQAHKVVLKRRKNSTRNQLQELSKKGKKVVVKITKKSHGGKRGNRGKPKRGKSKKSENVIHWHQRKRTVVHHPYWLSGLRRTHKSFDERAMHFREKKVLLPSQHTEDRLLQPVCSLCHEKYDSNIIYIACESCGDWFHGEVFCLTVENIDNLIGFKCPKCRMKRMPMCPFSNNASVAEIHLHSECNAGSESTGVKYQNEEEKLHVGTIEDCLATIHCEDHVKQEQREDGLKRPIEERVLYCKTSSTDEHMTLQSLEDAEAKVTSSRNENGIQIVVASEKMGKGMAVPELLVTSSRGDSAESHPHSIRTTVG